MQYAKPKKEKLGSSAVLSPNKKRREWQHLSRSFWVRGVKDRRQVNAWPHGVNLTTHAYFSGREGLKQRMGPTSHPTAAA